MKSEIIHRLFAAVVGGYLFSNIIAILLSYLLPTSRAEAVIGGVLLSFLVYTLVIIWAFSAHTIKRVWFGLLMLSLMSVLVIFLLVPDPLS